MCLDSLKNKEAAMVIVRVAKKVAQVAVAVANVIIEEVEGKKSDNSG